VRRTTPLFLSALLAAACVLPAAASVPSKQFTNRARGLVSQLDPRGTPDFSRGLNQSLDPHPFSNEFYLLQFASETVLAEAHQQRSSWFSPVLNPVTNAATALSKKVASLRHALARMMP